MQNVVKSLKTLDFIDRNPDCKSVVSDFGGSNPPSPTKAREINVFKVSRVLFLSFFYRGGVKKSEKK